MVNRPTFVLGIGNILMGDDGAGVHALRRLADHPDRPPGVVCREAGVAGFDMLPMFREAGRIVVFDAVDAGREAGEVFTLDAGDLRGRSGPCLSLHEVSVVELLDALELLDTDIPPVTVIGVQPLHYHQMRMEMSEAVERAIPEMVRVALEELRR